MSLSSLATATLHLSFFASSESGLELRATVKSIRAFAGLNLNEFTDKLQALSLRELVERLSLSFNAKA
jgi:hypothetical protein